MFAVVRQIFLNLEWGFFAIFGAELRLSTDLVVAIDFPSIELPEVKTVHITKQKRSIFIRDNILASFMITSSKYRIEGWSSAIYYFDKIFTDYGVELLERLWVKQIVIRKEVVLN